MSASVTIFVAASVIAAWTIGQQSAASSAGGLDYLMKPVPISDSAFATIGVVALALYAIALVYLLRLSAAADSRSRCNRSILLMTLAGIVLAGVYRIVTAGVIGANIGAPFTVLFGIPLCAYLVVRGLRSGVAEEPIDG